MELNENNKNANNNQNKVAENVAKTLNIILKTIACLIYTVLGIIAIILVYNIIQVSVLNKPYMNIFGYSIFRVETGSMSGTLEIGDIILVKITKDVEKNEVITYEKENILITHRIIEKRENDIITKGDANNSEDEPITKDNVIGKVVYTFKNIEIWKQVFKTPEVYILVTITLILFLITLIKNR